MSFHSRQHSISIVFSHQNSGFKFLPILGGYIADCFEGVAPQDLRQRWAWRPSQTRGKGDGSRGGPAGRKLTRAEQSRL